jgi:hypothetical protein
LTQKIDYMIEVTDKTSTRRREELQNRIILEMTDINNQTNANAILVRVGKTVTAVSHQFDTQKIADIEFNNRELHYLNTTQAVIDGLRVEMTTILKTPRDTDLFREQMRALITRMVDVFRTVSTDKTYHWARDILIRRVNAFVREARYLARDESTRIVDDIRDDMNNIWGFTYDTQVIKRKINAIMSTIQERRNEITRNHPDWTKDLADLTTLDEELKGKLKEVEEIETTDGLFAWEINFMETYVPERLEHVTFEINNLDNAAENQSSRQDLQSTIDGILVHLNSIVVHNLHYLDRKDYMTTDLKEVLRKKLKRYQEEIDVVQARFNNVLTKYMKLHVTDFGNFITRSLATVNGSIGELKGNMQDQRRIDIQDRINFTLLLLSDQVKRLLLLVDEQEYTGKDNSDQLRISLEQFKARIDGAWASFNLVLPAATGQAPVSQNMLFSTHFWRGIQKRTCDTRCNRNKLTHKILTHNSLAKGVFI